MHTCPAGANVHIVLLVHCLPDCPCDISAESDRLTSPVLQQSHPIMTVPTCMCTSYAVAQHLTCKTMRALTADYTNQTRKAAFVFNGAAKVTSTNTPNSHVGKALTADLSRQKQSSCRCQNSRAIMLLAWSHLTQLPHCWPDGLSRLAVPHHTLHSPPRSKIQPLERWSLSCCLYLPFACNHHGKWCLTLVSRPSKRV